MSLIPNVDDPTQGQTLKMIESYLRAVEEGSKVAIRDTHGGILMFQIAVVTGMKPRSGRLYTDKSGGTGGAAWYMKTGKNCYHPTGQSRLFIPTIEVRNFLQNHPAGILKYDNHAPE